MIQQLLTVTIEFSTIAAFGLFTIAFAHRVGKRQEYRAIAHRFRQRQAALATVEPASPQDEPEQPIGEEATVIHHSSTTADNIVPFVRPARASSAPDLSALTIRQLKALASAVRLCKYNQDSKAVLATRLLTEIDRAVLEGAIATLTAAA